MSNYDRVLAEACKLTDNDRLRLIDDLWETLPDESGTAISPLWDRELEAIFADFRDCGEGGFAWSRVYAELSSRKPK